MLPLWLKQHVPKERADQIINPNLSIVNP